MRLADKKYQFAVSCQDTHGHGGNVFFHFKKSDATSVSSFSETTLEKAIKNPQ
jgi:hypothetical protein